MYSHWLSRAVAASLSVSILVPASWSVPVYGAADQPNYTTYQAIALSYGGNPGLQRLVYMAKEKADTERVIREEPSYRRDKFAAEAYRRQRMDAANQTVTANTYKGTWVETGAKALVVTGGTLAAGPAFLAIPSEVVGKGVESMVGWFDRRAQTPNGMSDEELINIGAQILAISKDLKNPDCDWAREMVEKHLSLDPKLNYSMHHAAQENIKNIKMRDFMKTSLDRLNKLDEKDIEGRKKLAAEIRAGTQEILGEIGPQVLQALETFKYGHKLTEADRQRIARFEKYKNYFQETSQALGAAAGFLNMVGSHDDAHFIRKVIALNDAVSSAVELAARETAAGPGSYVNVYMTIIVAVVNLAQADQKQSEFSQMMNSLRQIAEQIEDVRKQMHERFDILDFNSRKYFEHTYMALGTVIGYNSALLQDVGKLNRKMDQMRFETLTGLSFLWMERSSQKDVRCRGVDPTTKRYYILTPVEAAECRDFYAISSTRPGDFSFESLHGGSTNLGQISANEYAALRAAIGIPMWQEASVHPSNWMMGSKNFLKFFKAHPEHKAHAPRSGVQNGVSLRDMIQTGEGIRQRLEKLTLTPSGGGRYTLNKEPFLRLLDKYRIEAVEAINLGNTIAMGVAKAGPKPARGMDSPAPLSGHDNFFIGAAGELDFCEGTPRAVEVSGVEIPSPQMTNTVLHSYLRPFSKTNIRWDARYLKFVPPSALWAASMGFQGAKVSACFSKLEVKKFKSVSNNDVKPEVTYHPVITMDFQLEVSGQSGKFSIARAIYDPGPIVSTQTHLLKERGGAGGGGGVSIPMLFIVNSPVPFITNIWNGPLCPNGCNIRTEGISVKGPANFKPVAIPESEQFTNFKSALKIMIDAQAADIADKVKLRLSGGQDVETGRLFGLLAVLGLDQKRPEAIEFSNWAKDEDSFPTTKSLLEFSATSVNEPRTLVKLIDERVAEAKAQLDKLGESTDLRPRTAEVESLISKLSAIGK